MDQKKTTKSRISFVIILTMAVGMFVGSYLNSRVQGFSFPSRKIPPPAKADFSLMAEAWNCINAHYVDQSAIKPRVLTDGAISGMVDALGDTGHSSFLTPQMLKQEESYTRGKYKGIGAEVRMKDGHVVIVTPLDGSPAQKAGLKPGEIILEVNGHDIEGQSLMKVVRQISGPAGTKVTLKLYDPKTNLSRTVHIVRAAITVNNVTWSRIPGTNIAFVRIAGFSEGVTKDLKKALAAVRQQNMQGLILDLRNDPGGLLAEAIDTTSQFLSHGNVLLEKDVKGNISSMPVKKGGVALHIPMVVLVNGGTASAPEIVAGALQDYKRATLVGSTTFGTGTVLQQFPLSNGSVLLLAVKEWLTPNGHTFWHKGIKPNIVVHLPDGVLPVFPREVRTMTPKKFKDCKDIQLLKAVGILTAKKEQKSRKAV